jgi:glutaminyl-tRNA synthetase
VAALKGAFDVASFEQECGVGVVVSPEVVAQSVATLCDSHEAALNQKKWNYQGQLFSAAKGDAVLKWADGYLPIASSSKLQKIFEGRD